MSRRGIVGYKQQERGVNRKFPRKPPCIPIPFLIGIVEKLRKDDKGESLYTASKLP